MTRQRAIPLVFAILAATFFALPVGLRAVGVTAHCCFENRPFAAAPKPADGWKVFDETTHFLIDRMPLRQQAVRANTWISENVFSRTPNYAQNGPGGVTADQALPFTGRPQQDRPPAATTPAASTPAAANAPPPAAAQTASQVVAGTHGWLFLQGVFDRACQPFLPFGVAERRWFALMRLIRASGRKVIFVIAPDKSTIYPEFVSPSTPNLACSAKGRSQLWGPLETPHARRLGVLALRRPLLADKQRTKARLYFRKDSHWDNVGSEVMVRAVVQALDPKVPVLYKEFVDRGMATYGGDLNGLLGITDPDRTPTRQVVRAPGAAVVPGQTLILGDSYGDAALGELNPYFASLTMSEWFGDSLPQIAHKINDADTVILEIVERELDYHASTAGFITPQLLALVRRDVKRR